MNFTPTQITIGKRLVNWLVQLGNDREVSRREVAGILKRFKVKDIQWGMQQSNCTSLKNLKGILFSRLK